MMCCSIIKPIKKQIIQLIISNYKCKNYKQYLIIDLNQLKIYITAQIPLPVLTIVQ